MTKRAKGSERGGTSGRLLARLTPLVWSLLALPAACPSFGGPGRLQRGPAPHPNRLASVGRGIAWIAVNLCRFCLFVGGLCVLSLAIGAVMWLFGEHEFLAPLEGGRMTGFSTFLWQTVVAMLAAFALWRVLDALLLRVGTVDDQMSARGWASDSLDVGEQRRDYGPVIGQCTVCQVPFRSWDAALDHAEAAHGQDRTPEEARALLERY